MPVMDMTSKIPKSAFLHSIAEAGRCLGVAQEKGDRAAMAYWAAKVDELVATGVATYPRKKSAPIARRWPEMKSDVTTLGRWREPNPHITPSAKVEWVAPGRTGLQTWVGMIDGHRIATIKRQPGHAGSACTALLDGWMWDLTDVPNPMQTKENVARGFESIRAAKIAITKAIRLHPVGGLGQKP